MGRWPRDTSGVEQDTESVMVEVGEPSAGPLDLLGAEVHALGRSVGRTGAVVVQDLAVPARQRVGERSDLGHLVTGTRGDGVG
jgi:hypothetical protein